MRKLIVALLTMASVEAGACRPDPDAAAAPQPKAEKKAPSQAVKLFAAGQAALERGDGPAAVKLYLGAARAGHADAAKRLGEIYEKGLGGVGRDYSESLKWYNAARVMGADIPNVKCR